MKKTGIVIFISFLVSYGQAFSCSTFCLKDSSNVVFGYNFDWFSSHGFLVTNNKGITKTAFMPFDDAPVKWTSKYGSITFNIFGKEFPFAGMNEKGLVIAQMWLGQTKYQESDERGSITELQWIQYQLDNSATIFDVIQSNKVVRITNKTTAPIHFMVSDNKGNTATIEFIDGRLVYHTGDELPIPLLCNDKYDKSLKSLVEFIDFGCNDSDLSRARDLVKGKYDDDRFIKGTDAIKKCFKKEQLNVPQSAFEVLEVLKQPHTNWSIVFDIKNFRIFYKTDVNPDIRTINFNDFSFDCNSKNLIFDVNIGNGIIEAGKFEYFTIEKNKSNIDYLVKNIIPRVNGLKQAPEELWSKMAAYPQKLKSKEE